MQLRDLPDDVLRLVLKASFTAGRDTTATLKANLPLLAVCRRWRCLALPIVYSSVAICYGKPNHRVGPLTVRANNSADEPNDAMITTSLDLVASTGCVQMVRRVEITVNHKINPLPGLDAAIRLMSAAAEVWKGARQLDILASPAPYASPRDINVIDCKGGIKKTCDALTVIMPGICRVSFNDSSANPIAWELGGQLAAFYSDRLQGLTSRHPVIVPPDHTFRQLKELSIRYKSDGNYQHLRVDPAKLVSLDLVLWSPNHPWASFSAGDYPKEIEFPSLKRLAVEYWFASATDGVERQQQDNHPRKLLFPKLEILIVDCGQDMCPLFEHAVLPPHMDEISIKATTPLLARVANMKLPASRRLNIKVSFEADGNPAALTAACRILENAWESKEVALKVYGDLLPVVPETITCTSLTELTVFPDTSVDTMLGLIRVLPRLAKLHIWSLTLPGFQEGIAIPGPDEICPAEPFSSNIKEIRVTTNLVEQGREMLVSVAKYLLLWIPTLAQLGLGSIPKESIAEFVNAYSKRYPHLAGINYVPTNKRLCAPFFFFEGKSMCSGRDS